ncbi:MAG: hypothetical protein ACREEW_13205 [Caulobacteraceae bacterium]
MQSSKAAAGSLSAAPSPLADYGPWGSPYVADWGPPPYGAWGYGGWAYEPVAYVGWTPAYYALYDATPAYFDAADAMPSACVSVRYDWDDYFGGYELRRVYYAC